MVISGGYSDGVSISCRRYFPPPLHTPHTNFRAERGQLFRRPILVRYILFQTIPRAVITGGRRYSNIPVWPGADTKVFGCFNIIDFEAAENQIDAYAYACAFPLRLEIWSRFNV
ncbi:hypothetical protein Pfo_014429 [Paulownia fortunei]|nr:hypothetical protein Pfo_014429 [Paulownia fortunei]